MNVHLIFDGRCEEAFRFYENCLGGKTVFAMKWGETPAAGQMPAEWADKMMHATFDSALGQLSGVDSPPSAYLKPQGFHVILEPADAADAERIFSGLAEGGSVHMPLQETFWALRYGSLTDRFGIPWEINCATPA